MARSRQPRHRRRRTFHRRNHRPAAAWLSSAPSTSVLNTGINISGDDTVDEGSSYTLALSSTDSNTITSWSIDWGDGSSVQVVSGNPSTVTHTFASATGIATITATATDANGTYDAGAPLTVGVIPTALLPASVSQGRHYDTELSSSSTDIANFVIDDSTDGARPTTFCKMTPGATSRRAP